MELTGHSAAWLAHLLWEQRVAGSNPVAPSYKRLIFKDVTCFGSHVLIHFWFTLVHQTMVSRE